MSNDALADLNGTLDRISATLNNRCGHCGAQIPEHSVSAYYCDDECQWRWQQAQATAPRQVESRPDAAPYPGGPMFWEPGLVTVDPGPDLARAGAVPAAMGYTGATFTATIYRRMSRAAWHLRLDDGHRFVGRDLPAAQLADEESMRAAATRTWDALETELTSEARAHPAPVEARTRPATVGSFAHGGVVRPGSAEGPWTDLGWTAEGMAESSEAAADLRQWLHGDSRPARRWCLACGECHPTTADAPHQCGRCRAVLPRLRHTIRRGILSGLTLTVSGPHGIFCQSVLLLEHVDEGVAAELLERLEGEVVRRMRAERERARYNMPALNPNLHAQVRGASWHVPISRHATEPLMSPTTADRMANALNAFAGWPEVVSRMLRTRAAEDDRAQERPTFADAVRQRRERQGHTGPQGRARAPRRIDPGGGAR